MAKREDLLEDLYEILDIYQIIIPNEIKSIEDSFDRVAAIIQDIEGLSGEQVIELKAHARDLAGLFLDLDDESDLLEKAEKIRWGLHPEDVETDD